MKFQILQFCMTADYEKLTSFRKSVFVVIVILTISHYNPTSFCDNCLRRETKLTSETNIHSKSQQNVWSPS